MNEVKKDVQEALAILSTLSVSGDVIDIMAAVRQKLKRAIKAMDDAEKGDEGG